MVRSLIIVLAALSVPALFGADRQWLLDQSTLTYHVSHPLHQVDGVSHAAKGKGVCHEGECNFLIAVPIKSFDSGDSNRDLHMLQVTHGAEFPLVTVRTRVPESASGAATFYLDLEVKFAGQTAQYKHVPFQQEVRETASGLQERSLPRSLISRLIPLRSSPCPSRTTFQCGLT